MARNVIKGLIGLQDMALGTSTFTRSTSTGGTQILTQINSSNLGSGFPMNTSSPVTPTGAVNGINKVFTLPTNPGAVVLVYLAGVLQNPGVSNDYTISGTTITFNTAPVTGPVLVVY